MSSIELDESCLCADCCEHGHCSCASCNEPCTCDEEEKA